jgi:MerR family transcriptional regulator, copper efflux regulator
MESIGIGELAKRAGVGIDTVRYYEREGLLKPRQRLASGYRRYTGHEISRLRFIRKAQVLGFSLSEIRDLLTLSSHRDVARVKKTAEAKLVDVRKRIAELERVRSALTDLVTACPGHGRAEECPILRALGGEDA